MSLLETKFKDKFGVGKKCAVYVTRPNNHLENKELCNFSLISFYI